MISKVRTTPLAKARTPRTPTARPADDDIEEVEPDRPTIEDPNDLDALREMWEDRGFVTPSSGGWVGPDD